MEAEAQQPGSLVPPRINGSEPAIPGLGGDGGPAVPPAIRPSSDGPRLVDVCRVDPRYDPAAATICALCILIGLLYTFGGYRCFKTTMFLTGFIFASGIVYLICLQGELLPAYGNAGVALFAGLLFGLITTLVQYVGLFMGGLHTGFLLALAALVTADYAIDTSQASPRGSVWLCVGVLLATALVFAIFNLYFRKGLTVLGTAVYGASLVTAGSDYLVERWAGIAWIWDRGSLRPIAPPPCAHSWIVLALWPGLALIGLFIQCLLTGRGTHHADVAAGRKKPRPGVHNSSRRVDRAELRQKKYRYLYQVRTAHGDVISQNFVQALQKKECDSTADGGDGSCNSNTLQSDATHLTILPDTGQPGSDAQLAALTESDDDSHTEITTRR